MSGPEPYLTRWQLVLDGDPIETHAGTVWPVRRGSTLLVLKRARYEEEQRGAEVMRWWDGHGAARVHAIDGDAVLLERATGPRSLHALALDGRDDEATRILCAVAGQLHAPRVAPPPSLVSLDTWFEPLFPAALHHSVLAPAATVARALLASPQEPCVLHGDLHHDNVLDSPRGWLAIDPKSLVGERTFDFANLVRNPGATLPRSPARFARQVEVIADAGGVDRTRLLQWILAFAGLSAAWIFGDGDEPSLDLAIAALAATALG